MKLNITSPSVLVIIKTIKAIQSRMKDPDLINKEYIQVYDKLSQEFVDFADNYTNIFTKVIRGEDMSTIAQVLYYKDKIEKGNLTETELSDLLAKKYLPTHLKEQADARIKEMKDKGEI